MSRARFLRQVLLPEIGAAGQIRIEAARAAVGGAGLAGEIAERYARGAGFAGIDPGRIDLDALAPLAVIREGAPRAVLAGSRAALAAMRAVVRQTPGGQP